MTIKIYDEVIQKTKEFVQEKLEKESSGHDWHHIERVCNNALAIAEKETGADLLIVQLGALLHDVMDHKFGYTDENREIFITDFLKNLDVSEEIISQVVYIVNNISYKGGTNKHKMTTLEGKIVQDADRLDAMGAIGIARAFAYGGHVNRVMHETIDHFHEKLLLLKDLMNTETGRKKALARHKVMEDFLRNFSEEWDGL